MQAPQVLRPMADGDVSDVLKLNAEHVELLSPLDAARLDDLRHWATRADVITSDGQTAGFVLVFGPGTDYDSVNYRWFGERYGARFDYLDRIVIDDREVAQLGEPGHRVSLMARDISDERTSENVP